MNIKLIIIPIVTVATAWLGSLVTGQGMIWYSKINLPSFTPPGRIIGMVWTFIFILATISAILVFKNSNLSKKTLIIIATLFIINSLLNIFWSYLFFGQHLLFYAIIEAGLLGLSVIILIIKIWPISITSAILLMPYLGWVSFATYLTYLIWKIN